MLEKENYFEIYNGTVVDANFLINYLKNYNIEAVFRSSKSELLFGGLAENEVGEVQVLVKSEDVEKAVHLTDAFFKTKGE